MYAARTVLTDACAKNNVTFERHPLGSFFEHKLAVIITR